MDQELMKVAADAPGVILAAAQHMRKLANDNVALHSRAEAAEHQLSCMKLARRMEERGLEQDLDFDQKVAELIRTPVEKLAAIEQALEMYPGGFRLGAVDTEEKTASEAGVGSRDALDTFINTGAAYGA